jgi:hypothetical protein
MNQAASLYFIMIPIQGVVISGKEAKEQRRKREEKQY